MSELIWSREDRVLAAKQGWMLTVAPPTWVVATYDLRVFYTSQEARAWVETQADQGDPLALKALAIIAKETMSPSAKYEDVSLQILRLRR
jgi:hypothetical protein